MMIRWMCTCAQLHILNPDKEERSQMSSKQGRHSSLTTGAVFTCLAMAGAAGLAVFSAISILLPWLLSLGLDYGSVEKMAPFRYTAVISAGFPDWTLWDVSPTWPMVFSFRQLNFFWWNTPAPLSRMSRLTEESSYERKSGLGTTAKNSVKTVSDDSNGSRIQTSVLRSDGPSTHSHQDSCTQKCTQPASNQGTPHAPSRHHRSHK